ncbi:hypothetical protein Tco_0215036 [Tanacetum coccineum]
MVKAEQRMIISNFNLGKPLTRSFRARSLIVLKFKWFKRRCHNHDLVLEALDNKHTGEDFIISSEKSIAYIVNYK